MSKDTNLLFKPAMVRGLLNGSKTKTRRLFSDKLCITENPGDYKLHGVRLGHDIDFSMAQKRKDDRSYALFEQVGGNINITEWIEPIEVPYAEVEDRIYVRETHYRFGKWQWMTHNSKGVPGWVFVPWNDEVRFEDNAPQVLGKERAATMNQWWRRPSLFMLKGHTRIIMEVVEKKVERLLDISEADAQREGVEHLFSAEEIASDASIQRFHPTPESSGYVNYMWHGMPGLKSSEANKWAYQYSSYTTARESFLSLWASINGVDSVHQNPWVIALGLKRVL